MTAAEEDREHAEQVEVFERLRQRLDDILEKYGVPDSLSRKGDYTIHGDYNGHPQVVAFIGKLEMLQPAVIIELQRLIKEFPGWEIEVTVAVRGHYDDWPNMGLYIRPHEIIDGLQRQYFSKEFQDIAYAGARRGTAYD
jgi:hypothetical protein